MASVIPFKLTPQILLAIAVLVLGVGFNLGRYFGGRSLEGFTAEGMSGVPRCSACRKSADSCSCTPKGMARLICPPCRAPDLSKYVLKSSIPPCPAVPELSNYMLKTECPPVPDLSKYVLKASIPKQQPVIIDNSACTKDSGECPPCPVMRCPVVQCPEPKACAPCAAVEPPRCPEPQVTEHMPH